MATLKITDLPDISLSAAAEDVLAIVDISDTSEAATGTTKKVEIQHLFEDTPIHAPSIYFGSTALGHYEEGSYTATITTDGGTVTLDGASNTLQYTRVGRTVHVSGLVTVSAVSSPTGSARISLPMESGAGTENSGYSVGSVYINAADASLVGSPLLVVAGSVSSGVLLSFAGGSVTDTASKLKAGTLVAISVTYAA